ncbi:hypothetical protein Tco_1140399 [Tanacetum coccineum]
MVIVGRMTYFQDHKWYDCLIDGCLKEETLMLKEQTEGSRGDATPVVTKFCTWLRDSFENFHELDYDMLVKLEECWWKNYEANNVRKVQEGQGYMENLAHETLACKIRRLEMMRYKFEADEEYVAIKELINHSETNMDARCAYR